MKTIQSEACKGDLYEAILIAAKRDQLWGLDRSRAAKQPTRPWASPS